MTQAAGLSALRDNTMADLASEGRSSRDLLGLASSLLRARELPKPDQDAFERRLLLLTGYLKAACKPFADALAPPPPPAGELTLAVPPGFACLQWYETSSGLGGASIEPDVTLLYLVATPPPAEGGGEEGPFLLGRRSVTRAAALATSRLLQRVRADAPAGPFKEGLTAVKELLVSPERDPEDTGSRPPSALPEGEETPLMKYQAASDAIGDASFATMAALFDPHMGGACTDEAVCAWLGLLLGEES